MMLDQLLPPPTLVPAILIENHDGLWRATAVIAPDAEPIGIIGPSTSQGASPAAALDVLLGRAFGSAVYAPLNPSFIAIDRTPLTREAVE